jgi:hypothetical protein
MPQRLDISAKRHQPGAFLGCRHCHLCRRQCRELFLDAVDLDQPIVPAPLQLGCDQAVVGIDGVILPPRQPQLRSCPMFMMETET